MQAVDAQQREFHTILERVITGEVIPKVFEAHGGEVEPLGHDSARMSEATVREFKALLLDGRHDACRAYVEEKIGSGLSLRAMCLGLFTQTARSLGDMWEDDELSFAEVTMGLGALHMLVHQFAATDPGRSPAGQRHNIVLASAPEEQHAFGVLLVSKIFEMEGWLVTGGPDLHTGAELTSLLSKAWFDVIGLTASSEDLAKSLKSDIEALRETSLNSDVVVIVGGSGFADHPELSDAIGADGLANDADDAVAKAKYLLSKLETKSGT